MKICYVDETGIDGKDRHVVMVGILVDAYGLNKTRVEFDGIFSALQRTTIMKELKGTKMIFGNDEWRKVDESIREEITDSFCNWVVERKHSIVLSAIDRTLFKPEADDTIPKQCKDIWVAGGLHIVLQIQKHFQKEKKNKGHTFLIFDDNPVFAKRLSDLLWKPPAWIDDYYGRKPKQDPLDQIINTTFTVNSEHAGLVQVADIFAVIFKRHAELRDPQTKEKVPGERVQNQKYVDILKQRLLPKSARWPSKNKSASAKWFSSIAPESLRSL